ncbi:HNH endonuclease [Pseudomonas segetis]
MAISLNDLTSPDAVLQAIKEFDLKGREKFLSDYGYKKARAYLLSHGGKLYDSKAIVGVAYGNQHGTPLKYNDFGGVKETVVQCLSRLGFHIAQTAHPALTLVRGSIYFRKDLVATYGGQLQAGIWTPKEFAVIFIFSGDSGESYGYRDGWEDGVFNYTGEGQVGHMQFKAGNKAIRDHRKNRKDLLLFKDLGKGKGVRYEGLFGCEDHHIATLPDKKGNDRDAIIFHLMPVSTGAGVAAQTLSLPIMAAKVGIAELRAAAYLAAAQPQASNSTAEAKRSWYKRSEDVKLYVLARSKGECEACNQPAPFNKKDGTPYLEPHHTMRLADEGPDHPEWVGAICPNCHRQIHSGQDGESLNLKLQNYLKHLEAAQQ